MTDDSLSRALADWIMESALNGASMTSLVEGAANRVLGNGVPLRRAHVTFRTLHPSFESVSLVWRREEGVFSQEFVHGSAMHNGWTQSPFAFMIQNGTKYLRRRLTGESAVLDFPVFEEFVEEGFTDYFAVTVPFDSREIALAGNRPDGIATSWITDRAGGFSDAHIAALQHLVPRLAVACKLAIREQIARNVANAYLGNSAGQQVLNGHIRLGDYETINAIVWFADLRDSTGRLERLGMERYLALLNGFLECAAGAVQVEGGEILAYPGDAVLAIFRNEEPAQAAEAALVAAAEFRRRLFDVNANLAEMGQDTLEAGLAVHQGEIAFGNIGTGGRQAFTVIGPAVNVVNRLEAITKTESHPVVLSAAVDGLLPPDAPPRHQLGGRQVRGSDAPIGVFGMEDSGLLRFRAPPGYAETVLEPLSATLETAYNKAGSAQMTMSRKSS